MFDIIEKYIQNGDTTSKLGNISSICMEYIENLNWVGFYFYQEKFDALILGPFSGKKATSLIKVTDGVCGSCFTSKTIQNVEDVHNVCNHIACDIASNSELVLPIYVDNKIVGVMDIDSPIKGRFDEDIELLFKKVLGYVEDILSK